MGHTWRATSAVRFNRESRDLPPSAATPHRLHPPERLGRPSWLLRNTKQHIRLHTGLAGPRRPLDRSRRGQQPLSSMQLVFAVLVAILHLLGTSRGQASAEWPGTAACEPGAGLMCSSTAHIFQGWLQRDGLLSEALASSRTTVFAPSDRAMRLLAALMSERDLLEDSELRKQVLLAHFVPGALPASSLLDNVQLATAVRGVSLSVTSEATASSTIFNEGGSETLGPQVVATDGVLYLMDEPLVEILEQVGARSRPQPAADMPRPDKTQSCQGFAARVAEACKADMCGTCHGTMCVASQLTACHNVLVSSDGSASKPMVTFWTATWGTFPVCRTPCQDLAEGIKELVAGGTLTQQEGDALQALQGKDSGKSGSGAETRVFVDVKDKDSLCDYDKPCPDTPTPDGFSCKDQLDWGKCELPWMRMGGFCRLTCGDCFRDCLSLKKGAQCSTTPLRRLVPLPCGPGLECRVLDPGSAPHDVPDSGVCAPRGFLPRIPPCASSPSPSPPPSLPPSTPGPSLPVPSGLSGPTSSGNSSETTPQPSNVARSISLAVFIAENVAPKSDAGGAGGPANPPPAPAQQQQSTAARIAVALAQAEGGYGGRRRR